MNDFVGAAGAAAEPVNMPQDAGGGPVQPDAGLRQPEPVIDRSKETARASVDRAFAELDKQDKGEGGTPERVDSRDEHGRFKAKDAAGEGQPQPGDKGSQPPNKPRSETDEPGIEAPSRFSAEAKAAWSTVPGAVKGEVERTVNELEAGLQQYQQFFAPMKPYYEMAQRAGVTVHESLENYVRLDRALVARDPQTRLSAIEEILSVAGVSPRDYAALIMGQKPDEQQSRYESDIRHLQQQNAEFRRQIGGISQSMAQRREDEAVRQVENFAKENVRLNEPEFQYAVIRLLQSNMADDLEGAYDMADRLIPALAQAPQPNLGSYPGSTKPPAAQTRNGNLSVTGAPGSGSNPTKRKTPATARESVDSAFASLGIG